MTDVSTFKERMGVCSNCGSKDTVVAPGYEGSLGKRSMIGLKYASALNFVVCKKCGFVIGIFAENPEKL